jgi:hypothetical protein
MYIVFVIGKFFCVCVCVCVCVCLCVCFVLGGWIGNYMGQVLEFKVRNN